MADLSFEALASSEHVLSSAENFVLYVLLEAVAGGKGGAGRRQPAAAESWRGDRSFGIDVRRAAP